MKKVWYYLLISLLAFCNFSPAHLTNDCFQKKCDTGLQRCLRNYSFVIGSTTVTEVLPPTTKSSEEGNTYNDTFLNAETFDVSFSSVNKRTGTISSGSDIDIFYLYGLYSKQKVSKNSGSAVCSAYTSNSKSTNNTSIPDVSLTLQNSNLTSTSTFQIKNSSVYSYIL